MSLTVLIADDNPATRYSTSRFLRAADFEVLEAKTGQEALDLAQRQPDAVVLDVNLPDMHGFEVCKALRASKITAKIPILHLSASFVAPAHKVQGLDAGADGYLTHPVEPQVLAATIKALIRAYAAEDALRQSEAKFRAIFDRSAGGIVLMDTALTFLEVNHAMCEFLGMASEDILGKTVGDFVHPELKEQNKTIREEIVRHGSWHGVLTMFRGDGRKSHLEWTITIHSEPDIRLALVTDITERLESEAERNRLYESERNARSEAERANRLKDEFLATISHELRAPLNVIVGWSQVLKRIKSQGPDDYKVGIDAIDRNAKLQAQLISDLLDTASITTGKLRLNKVPTNLAELVEQARIGMQEAADRKDLVFETHIADRSINVFGDPGRLLQVLSNLLTNAIKFTPTGGCVRVSLERDGDMAEIVVADTGKGILPEFLPFIFDSFRQQDSATTRRYEGLGLGLAIVKRLIEMHQGTVRASSAGENKGTELIVRLPLHAAHELDASPGLERLTGLRVMFVDDDPDARLVIARACVEYGIELLEASSAAEALAQLDDTIQILISDISMPSGDGYDLIQSIRDLGHDATRLPAIALTAYSQPKDIEHALAKGFQTHVAKPIDIDSLMKAMHSLYVQSH